MSTPDAARPRPTEPAAAAEASPRTDGGERSPGASVEFAVATRGFLQGQITLADSKAAVVLTMSVMILAYVIRSGNGTGWQGLASIRSVQAALGAAAVVALGAGVIGALAVVLPRYASGPPRGYVYWQAVLAHEEPRDYAAAVLSLGESDLEASLLEDCHRLASICARKFRLLRLTMWSASLGLLLGMTRAVLF